MPRRGTRRSNYAEQRRYQGYIISQNAFTDHRKAESVNVLGDDELAYHLFNRFDDPLLCLIGIYSEGEILSDARGEGSHQHLDTTTQ